MKNVLILATGGNRYAIELRWVSEIISLGDVTRVPRAPRHILGVTSVRGAVTPVLDIDAVRGDAAPSASREPRRGQGAVLVEVDGVVAAVRMDAVDEVSTVSHHPGGERGVAAASPGDELIAGSVVDSQDRVVPLCDVPRLLSLARQAARSHDPFAPPGDGVPDVIG